MKDIIIIILIVILIFGGDYLIQSYLARTTDEILQELRKLKEETISAEKENENMNLKKTMEKVEEKWEKNSNIWSIIVVHQEIDNIEQALVKIKSNIENGELEDAIPEIETAIFLAEHIKEREELKFKNIF